MEYSSQECQSEGSVDGKTNEQAQRIPYSMHGVLHYLQHEWSRHEMERAQWDMERAELQARISFLQGERKGQENLKADLIRRIRMLEYSLKQERAKNYRLAHNGQEQPESEIYNGEEDANHVPLDVDAYQCEEISVSTFRNARSLLRQYLQEIGYSEKILDVRSFRAKSLLGLVSQNDWLGGDLNSDSRQTAGKTIQEADQAMADAAQFLSSQKHSGERTGVDESDSDDDDHLRKSSRNEVLDPETVDALGEFSFLKEESLRTNKQQRFDNGEWDVNQHVIDQMKEKFRMEQEKKRRSVQNDLTSYRSGNMEMLNTNDMKRDTENDNVTHLFGGSGKGRKENSSINLTFGLNDDSLVDIKDDFAGTEDDTCKIQWNLKFILRSHFDSIRAMQFHPVEPVLITASEDGTAKLWNFGNVGQKCDAAKGAQIASQTMSINEIEPIYTFRGHRGPILSMDMSPTGDMCYTAGLDGIICCWSVPSVNTDIYDIYDQKVLSAKLKGHTDSVWSIAYHSSDNRLVSASSDGTVRLWEPGSCESPIKTFPAPSPKHRPTSVDFVSTEHQQLLVAYTNSQASILDLETGRAVLSFNFEEDAGLITKIVSHPTMPVTITAGDDRKIRYFDNNSGKLIHGTVAHVQAISSLAIDPNGLYLLSGSHDGSLRLWNMEKRICLREIAAHRRKFDSAVMTVGFHPSRPLIGSAGADGLAKVFGSQKYSYGGSTDC